MFKYVADGIVNFRRDDGTEAQLCWGGNVEVLGETDDRISVSVHGFRGKVARGLISSQA